MFPKTSYKQGNNITYKGYNPRDPFIRPCIADRTPLMNNDRLGAHLALGEGFQILWMRVSLHNQLGCKLERTDPLGLEI